MNSAHILNRIGKLVIRDNVVRIAHLCLANLYVDAFGYQENLLSRAHRRAGHEVVIIASTETYVDQAKLGYVAPSSYLNEDGLTVHRLPYPRWIPRRARSKVRAYEGLWKRLEEFQPDLIFLHGVQFFDILVVRRYALSQGTRVHADNHADYINSARSFISRWVLHGIFYRILAKRADAVIQRYFPTLPARGDFMHEVYGTSRTKMHLLPFGFDDAAVQGIDRNEVRRQMRERLGIENNALVLVSGGKLDIRKNIHSLVESFSRLQRQGEMHGVHLLIFGTPSPEVENALATIDIAPQIHMLGWTPPTEIFRVFWASDVAFFPGTHSVLWEEAVGHGLATVFRHWHGMGHLDLGGNAIFIEDSLTTTIDRTLRALVANDGIQVRKLVEVAMLRGPREFSFSEIARKAIE